MTGYLEFTNALKQAVLVSQICGVFPYSLDGTRLYLSLPRIAYHFFVLVVIVSSLITATFYQFGTFDSHLEWNISKLKVAVVTVTTVCTMIAMLFITDKLNCWIDAICSSEEATSGFMKTSFSYRRWDSVAHYGIYVVLLIVELNVYNYIQFLKIAWGIHISGFVTIAFINQFVGMICIIKQAFLEINRSFSKTTLEKLEASVIAFERLTSASEELNEAYGTQLLLMVGGNFILATTNAFLLVNEPRSDKKIMLALECAISAWSPFRLVQACVNLVNESKEFNILLRTILVEQNGLAESARLRLHLSMKKEIEFTARGFFALDYGLINAMLGAVTTYLVILIQFDESSSK